MIRNKTTNNMKKEIEEKKIVLEKKLKEKIKEYYQDFKKIINKPELRVLPGQLSFSFLLSIIPIIALFALIASYLIKNFDLLTILTDTLPKGLAGLIYTLLDFTPTTKMIIVFACYIWLASNGPSGITVAANTLYGIKVPKYLELKGKGILMTVIILLLLIFIILIQMFGDVIINFTLSIVKQSVGLNVFAILYHSFKYLVTIFIIYINIKLLYIIAPDKKIRSKHVTIGAIFTTACWFIITEAFGYYITEIAKYDEIYGNFANILILLLWVYFLAYAFVVGLAINVNNYEKYKNSIKEGSNDEKKEITNIKKTKNNTK